MLGLMTPCPVPDCWESHIPTTCHRSCRSTITISLGKSPFHLRAELSQRPRTWAPRVADPTAFFSASHTPPLSGWPQPGCWVQVDPKSQNHSLSFISRDSALVTPRAHPFNPQNQCWIQISFSSVFPHISGGRPLQGV